MTCDRKSSVAVWPKSFIKRSVHYPYTLCFVAVYQHAAQQIQKGQKRGQRGPKFKIVYFGARYTLPQIGPKKFDYGFGLNNGVQNRTFWAKLTRGVSDWVDSRSTTKFGGAPLTPTWGLGATEHFGLSTTGGYSYPL